MDDSNVIELSTDPNNLDDEMNKFLALPFKLRKIADDTCIARYGCTNQELYNKFKAAIMPKQDLNTTNSEELNITSDPVNESSEDSQVQSIKYNIPDYAGITGEKSYEDLQSISTYDRIHNSNALEMNDPNIIIINDFLDDSNPDYSLSDLAIKHDRFLLLPQQYKEYSNSHSLSIWGKTVPEMYIYMKNKILTRNLEGEICKNSTDKILEEYLDNINYYESSGNILECLIHKVDCLAGGNSLYENSVLESESEIINPEKIKFDSIVPMVTPFMTPSEYEFTSNEINNNIDYIFIDKPKMYYDTIKRLQSNLTEENANTITLLGWNPYVKINADSMSHARNKQVRWLNANESSDIIDLSNYSTDIRKQYYESTMEIMQDEENNKSNSVYPLYIVLSIKDDEDELANELGSNLSESRYCSADISLDSSLNELYAYSTFTDYNGIKHNSFIKDDINLNNICVLTFFVDTNIIYKIKNLIKETAENHYNNYTRNYDSIVFNSMSNKPYSINIIFSQVIDLIVSTIKDTKEKNIKGFIVYKGYFKDYNYTKIDKTVYALRKQMDYNQLSVYSDDKIMDNLRSFKIEAFNCACTNDKINNVLKEIRSYISPKSIITERKYISINDKGSLIIVKPADLEKEYQECHRLLYNYDESNLNGIEHELAHLFYLNEVIEKKIDKTDKKKNPDDYKKLIDLRARVLNDFTTYFKIVKSADPKFDFAEYMKNSEYYTKTIEVDETTLKYIGSIIKLFLGKLKK